MEHSRPIHLRLLAETPERALLDVLAAIELVAAGGARRVVLSSLPGPELVAAEALAHAQAAGVEFRLAPRSDGRGATVVIGPLRP